VKRYRMIRGEPAHPGQRGLTMVVVEDDLAPGFEGGGEFETLAPRSDRGGGGAHPFEWGYGGAGPALLASSILFDHLDAQPTPACYQDFKADRIAGLAHEGGVITAEEIDEWLVKWTARNVGFLPVVGERGV
jgi:hypothetical protein